MTSVRTVTDVMGEIVAIEGGVEPAATAPAALKDFEVAVATAGLALRDHHTWLIGTIKPSATSASKTCEASRRSFRT